MTSNQWLKQATDTIKAANIGSARLDALILLEDEIERDRAWILAHPEHEVLAESLKKLNKKLVRRASHEPLAYIRGKTEFYGREFLINKDVLEPRPESETMIELLKKVASDRLTVADVGTGSGALGITAALEVPEAEVIATDIDSKCLAVAKSNASRLDAKVEFFKGNLLEPIYSLLATSYVLLCNLPYVPDNFQINDAAMNEPRIAIFGGPDGLDLYRRLFEQINRLRQKPQFVFTESLPPQHTKLAALAASTGYKLTQAQDFIQFFESSMV